MHNKANIQVIASQRNWIEGEAIRQLENTAEFEGMEAVVGLPDLHPGKGTPIGAAYFNRNRIYPHLIGNDIGCGIGLWQTSVTQSKTKRDKWVKKLKNLNLPWNGDHEKLLQDNGLASTPYNSALGTIGAGNHFVELQMIEKVHDQRSFDKCNLNKNNLMLLVHSGSRGLGNEIFRHHTAKFGAKGLAADSQQAQEYLEDHDQALRWASVNRSLLAQRFMEQINGECRTFSDIPHNFIEKTAHCSKMGWLHRKGAAPATLGPVVIPGSRGTFSYLVKPMANMDRTLWSIAHGAGRKWQRNSCRDRLSNHTSVSKLHQTSHGNVVICDDKQLLFEEAPQAYKNIATVIDDMVNEKMIEVIATLRPLITYKTRKKK